MEFISFRQKVDVYSWFQQNKQHKRLQQRCEKEKGPLLSLNWLVNWLYITTKQKMFSKNKKNEGEVEEEEIIDLTKFKGAKEVARRYYQDLGACQGDQWNDNVMQSYLTNFEKADLTFPQLWSREKLFECANKVAVDDRIVFPPVAKSTEKNSRISRRNSETICGKSNRKPNTILKEKNANNYLAGCIFYSEPVHLRSLKRSKSMTSSQQLHSQHGNRLPPVNPRGLRNRVNSMSSTNISLNN